MSHESALAPSEDAFLYSNKYSLLILLAGSLTMAGAAGFARYTFPRKVFGLCLMNILTAENAKDAESLMWDSLRSLRRWR